MKNIKARAWLCVGIMMTGVVIGMSSMAFLSNRFMSTLLLVLAAVCFLGGVILHFATVRCPHCGSYLGRVYGTRCPFCGEDYNKTE